jgi:putative phosphoesterase
LKIGLTGDTHNNLKNVAVICDIFNSQDLDFVIHTGDISLPKTLKAFEKLNVPLKGVFGNNDQRKRFFISR